MKKAFTLIELLVVIGIIGILMAVLLNVSTKVLDAGRNTKCMANMHNLAAACSTYQMQSGHYPLAGSYEQASNIDEQSFANATAMQYDECPAWISWYSAGKYAGNRNANHWDSSSVVKDHISESSWYSSTYTKDFDEAIYCLSNGVLWKIVGGSRDIFRCPIHYNSSGTKPTWSYVMNAAFQWFDIDEDDNGYINAMHGMGGPYKAVGGVARKDKTLLFAEIQFKRLGTEPEPERNSSPGYDFDCVLQTTIDPDLYRGNFYPSQDGGLMSYEGDECIGFNHGGGKLVYGHVCFVDGHVEKVVYPRNGMSKEDAAYLTKLLCNGVDVSFNGSKYEEFK